MMLSSKLYHLKSAIILSRRLPYQNRKFYSWNIFFSCMFCLEESVAGICNGRWLGRCREILGYVAGKVSGAFLRVDSIFLFVFFLDNYFVYLCATFLFFFPHWKCFTPMSAQSALHVSKADTTSAAISNWTTFERFGPKCWFVSVLEWESSILLSTKLFFVCVCTVCANYDNSRSYPLAVSAWVCGIHTLFTMTWSE